MTEQEEADCLGTNPFDGDFGSPGDRVLKDKIGTAKKAGECHDCAQQIQPGERVRMRTDITDGELMSFRWCEKCCIAMAANDGGAATEARIALRYKTPNAELTRRAEGTSGAAKRSES